MRIFLPQKPVNPGCWVLKLYLTQPLFYHPLKLSHAICCSCSSPHFLLTRRMLNWIYNSCPLLLATLAHQLPASRFTYFNSLPLWPSPQPHVQAQSTMIVPGPIYALNASEALGLLKNNTITVEEYARSLLDRIKERDSTVNAWAYLGKISTSWYIKSTQLIRISHQIQNLSLIKLDYLIKFPMIKEARCMGWQ